MDEISVYRRAREILNIRDQLPSIAWFRVLDAYGLSPDQFFRLIITVIQLKCKQHFSDSAIQARINIINRAPHVLEQFHTVQNASIDIQKLRSLASQINLLCCNDRAQAQTLAIQTLVEIMRSRPKKTLDPETVADWLIEIADLYSEVSDFAGRELHQFNNKEPGCIPAILKFEEAGRI